MRIALITNRYSPNSIGGAEKTSRILSEGITNQGYELSVLSLNNGHEINKERGAGVEIDRLKIRNLYVPGTKKQKILTKALWHTFDSYNFLASKDVYDWLLINKPDVVHTHNLSGFSPIIWRSVKKLDIQLIHTLHDYYFLCPRTTMFKNSKICEKPCLECKVLSQPKMKLTNLVDTVVGVSNHILDQHIINCGFLNSRKVVIYNGIELSEPAAIEKEKKIFEGKPLQFGYIGKINESKGLKLLLEEFIKLPSSKASLLIAGTGNIDYLEKLKELTKGRANVEWLGHVEPEPFYKNLDVIVIPSLWNEPFGLVAIEPLEYGVPVIVSNRGGLSEIITSEEIGWCFDPDQPSSLFELLENSIQNSKKIRSMGGKVMQCVERFSSNHMINSYIKEYKRLMS